MDNVIENISIIKLAQIENLSTQSFNICYKNGLKDLYSIGDYYKQNGDFRKLRWCGEKYNQELIGICKKYFQLYFQLENVIENFSITKLVQIENLSVRSFNVCEGNNLNDIYSILIFFRQHGSFIKLRSCGVLTDLELTGICKKYENAIIFPGSTNHHIVHTDPFLLSIDSLTVMQKNILNMLIKYSFGALSPTISEALISYLNEISIYSIRFLYLGKKSYLNRKNSETDRAEINQFINTVKNLIHHVIQFENQYELRYEIVKMICKNKLPLHSAPLSEIKEIYDCSYKLPIFKILNALLERGNVSPNRQKIIFNEGLDYYNNNREANFSKIEFGVSGKEISQLQKIVNDFTPLFNLLKKICVDDIQLYGLDVGADYFVVDDTIVSKINNAENTKFDKLIIKNVLSIIVCDRYTFLGNGEKSGIDKRDYKKQKKRCKYFVSNAYASQFEFAKLMKDVETRLSQSIRKDYSLNFETYILQFFKAKSPEYSKEIMQIVEFMLFNEYKLTIDEGFIVFKRNTKKIIAEYIIEILEKRRTNCH